LFQLRGRTKEQIIEALRKIRGQAGSEVESESQDAEAAPPPSPTPIHLESFWQYSEQLEPSLVVIAPPPSSETVLDVLGPIPLKPDPATDPNTNQATTQAVMAHLKEIYQQVSQQAILTGMTTGGRGNGD
jgi:uncharacterized Zn finger protein